MKNLTTRRSACTGKIKHASLAAAQKHQRHLERTQGTRWLHSYPCKWCKGFHVGHMPYNMRQSVRDKRRNW